MLLQSKLLRALEEGEIRRVGGTRRRKISVRILAATNKDLEQMVKSGTFREDLYYRLNVIPLSLPPLRERAEDIVPLATSFLEDIGRKNSREMVLGADVRALLCAYHWPGNIRELRNIIERLAVVSPGTIIDASACEAMSMPFASRFRAEPSVPESNGVVPLKQFQDKAEAQYLAHVHRACCGDVRTMAEVLQVHRTGLYRKLKKLKLPDNHAGPIL